MPTLKFRLEQEHLLNTKSSVICAWLYPGPTLLPEYRQHRIDFQLFQYRFPWKKTYNNDIETA